MKIIGIRSQVHKMAIAHFQKKLIQLFILNRMVSKGLIRFRKMINRKLKILRLGRLSALEISGKFTKHIIKKQNNGLL